MAPLYIRKQINDSDREECCLRVQTALNEGILKSFLCDVDSQTQWPRLFYILRCPMSQNKVGRYNFFHNFGKSWQIFMILHCWAQKWSADEAWIKTFPQICCRTTLRKVNVQLKTKQLRIHISKNNKPHVRRYLFHQFLFPYLFFLIPGDIIGILYLLY